MFFAHYAIDILVHGINKESGIHLLSKHVNISPNYMAAIGDSDGDIALLTSVEHSFAPANASSRAKKSAQFVSTKFNLDAVLEAYEQCIQINKKN